jgi:outer membrane protein TolC
MVSLLLLGGFSTSFAQSPALTISAPVIAGPTPNPTINLNPPTPQPLTATAPITLPDYHEVTGPQMTIEQAVQIALDNNTQVAQSALQLKEVHYESQQITGQAYPQISISASDTYSNRDTSPGGVTSAVTNLSTSVISIPQITDTQAGSLFSSSNLTASSQTGSATTTTTGGGSSTTSAPTTTIVPVTGPVGGTTTSTSGSSGSDAIRVAQQGTTTTSPIIQQFTETPFRINNYGGRLSLSQLVDVNGLVSTSEKLLQNEVKFYTFDLERVENETALNTKNQYYSVLRAEEQLATDEEQVTNTQAELTDAQNRYTAGTSPAFDVVSAQTQLSNAQQSLIDAETTLDVQRATLNSLLNRPIDTPFTPSEPATPTLPTGDTDADEVTVALSHRPELLESHLAIDIAGKIVKLDHAGLLPEVALTAAMTYNGYASFPNGLGTSSSITAAVTLPLYDGGQTAALVNEARTNVQIEEQIQQGLESDVTLEVRSAFVNVKNGTALVAANTQGVAEAKESLRLSNIRYKAGTGTLLEVTNAEANLAVAETNLATARYQLQTEYASLQRAEGLR